MGAPGDNCFPNCIPWNTHLPDGPIPSLAIHRTGCPTPSPCCHGRWESCCMPRARSGWGLRDRHVLADAAARAGSSQTWVAGLLQHPQAAPQTSPPPGLGFSAGNETSSNYSSQARKSGRSHGPGLTQLRSAVSGRTARSPLLPLFICPAGSCEVTNFANNEPHRGVWGGWGAGERKGRCREDWRGWGSQGQDRGAALPPPPARARPSRGSPGAALHKAAASHRSAARPRRAGARRDDTGQSSAPPISCLGEPPGARRTQTPGTLCPGAARQEEGGRRGS